MTANNKLRQAAEERSDAETQDTLRFIPLRCDQHDALGELLANARTDDEGTTSREDEGADRARAQIARGEVVSADDIRREVA